MGYEVNLANIANVVANNGTQVVFSANVSGTGSVNTLTGTISATTATFSGEYRQVPPATNVSNLPAQFTTANRNNVESAIVASYQGSGGTVSYNGIASDPHYIKKFFNMSSSAGGTFNQTMVEIDGRTTNFHELWIKITWGTRIQGISDSTSALCERAYGVNKFNGQLINYNINNTWNHIDSNSDTYMDINVVNSPTTGVLLVQYQQASAVTGSSFIWGYIEMMSVETLGGTSGIPIRFNC
jgi:hypothetical protein